MAYFANGDEGEYYQERYCERCVHNSGNSAKMCPVLELHMIWNYDAVGQNADQTKRQALNTLWPRTGAHNDDCAMFHPKEQ